MATLRVNLNSAATAALKDNQRLRVELRDGVIRIKPTDRADPNACTAAVRRRPSGTSYFTLNAYQQKRLQHLHGEMKVGVGDRIAFETAPYRWLEPVKVNEIVSDAPMATIAKD